MCCLISDSNDLLVEGQNCKDYQFWENVFQRCEFQIFWKTNTENCVFHFPCWTLVREDLSRYWASHKTSMNWTILLEFRCGSYHVISSMQYNFVIQHKVTNYKSFNSISFSWIVQHNNHKCHTYAEFSNIHIIQIQIRWKYRRHIEHVMRGSESCRAWRMTLSVNFESRSLPQFLSGGGLIYLNLSRPLTGHRVRDTARTDNFWVFTRKANEESRSFQKEKASRKRKWRRQEQREVKLHEPLREETFW